MAMALGEMNLPCGHCQEDPALQRENGCIVDSPIPDRWQIGKYTFQRCPGKLVTRQSFEYIKAFNWMEKGFLPSPGGWMEQSAKFIKAMDFIKKEIILTEKKKMDRDKIGVNL